MEEKSQRAGRCTIGRDVEEKAVSRGRGSVSLKKYAKQKCTSHGEVKKILNMGNAESDHSGGTRSLELIRSPDRQVPSCETGIEAGHETKKPMLQSSLKNKEIGAASEMEERSSCIHLSLEEFSLLPSAKEATKARSSLPDHPYGEPPLTQKSSPTLEKSEFGHFSSMAGKETGLGSSALKNIEALEPSEKNERMVLAAPYRLEDDMDFPPFPLRRLAGQHKMMAVKLLLSLEVFNNHADIFTASR